MSNITVQHSGAITTQTEDELILVLQNSLYPGANIGSVRMVLGYCQAAGLDPMQKPVHIVPMWDSKAGGMRDVVMPGVNLYRTQASRTGKFAGMTEPEYGPMISDTLGGQKIAYPEWCRVTAKKLMENGAIAEFTVCEYWMENYAMKGGKEKSIAPNAMWTKRPRGQIAKCAEAQALRKAFPECGSQPTAEEMEGKSMGAEVDITPQGNPADWIDVAPMIAEALATKKDSAALKFWKENNGKLVKQPNDHKRLKDAISEHRAAMKSSDEARTVEMPKADPLPQAEIDSFVAAMDEGSAQ